MAKTKTEEILLGVFSFYEPMTFSKLILDLGKDDLASLGHLSREELEEAINSLLKQGLIKAVTIDKERGWIRIHPRRSWWKRLISLFASL